MGTLKFTQKPKTFNDVPVEATEYNIYGIKDYRWYPTEVYAKSLGS